MEPSKKEFEHDEVELVEIWEKKELRVLNQKMAEKDGKKIKDLISPYKLERKQMNLKSIQRKLGVNASKNTNLSSESLSKDNSSSPIQSDCDDIIPHSPMSKLSLSCEALSPPLPSQSSSTPKRRRRSKKRKNSMCQEKTNKNDTNLIEVLCRIVED